MIKIKGLCRAVLVCAFAVSVSCVGGGPIAPPVQSLSPKDLVGAWYYQGETVDDGSDWSGFTPCVLLNIKADGVIDAHLFTDPDSTVYVARCTTTYSVTGNKLAIYEQICEEGGALSHIRETTYTHVVLGDGFTLANAEKNHVFSKWRSDLSEIRHASVEDIQAQVDRVQPGKSIPLSILDIGLLEFSIQ